MMLLALANRMMLNGNKRPPLIEDLRAHSQEQIAELRVLLELPSNEAVRAAVEAGLGATAISSSVAVASLEAGLLHQVDFRLPEREFHLLTHRERYASRAAQAFLQMLNAAPGAKRRNEKRS